MARKSAVKQASATEEAPEAKAPEHPWFPGVEASKIARLEVRRVVYEDRPKLPGSGTTSKVLLTPKPLPPSALVNEETLAATWGPGHYEISAKNAAGQFASGAPYVAKIADDDGHVPMYVREFEDEEDELVEGASPTERLLRTELQLAQGKLAEQQRYYRELLDDQRKTLTAQMSAMREAHQADFAGLSGLMDRVNVASAAAQQAPAQGGPLAEWAMGRVKALEEELALLRRGSGSAIVRAGDPKPESKSAAEMNLNDWFELGAKALPIAKEFMDTRASVEKERIDLEREKFRARENWKLGGVAVPTPQELRAALDAGKTPGPRLMAHFQAMFEEGMLPPLYAGLLKPYLRPFDGVSGEATPISGGTGEAVG